MKGILPAWPKRRPDELGRKPRPGKINIRWQEQDKTSQW